MRPPQRRASQHSLEPVDETHELETYPPRQPEAVKQKAEKPDDNNLHGFNETHEEAAAEAQEDEANKGRPGSGVKGWWKKHIARVVPVDDDVRDHFALERTFLAYVRTSNAVATTAIAIFQLSRLSLSSSSARVIHPRILALEKAITILMVAGALLITVIGALRFFRRQEKIERGNMKAGGFDLSGIGWGLTVVEILLFVSILLN